MEKKKRQFINPKKEPLTIEKTERNDREKLFRQGSRGNRFFY